MSTVSVNGPSRLHFGLVNESGLYGRVDGGVGLALEEPCWEIEISEGQEDSFTGISLEHIQSITNARDLLCARFKVERNIAVKVNRGVDLHIGLGSKTSLLLALGAGILAMEDKTVCLKTLATLLRRGGTSGIGVNASISGGLIWDAGHSFPDKKSAFQPTSVSHATPPKVISRVEVDWFKVVHFRFQKLGLSGQDELTVFSESCPVSVSDTLEIAGLVSQKLLPGFLDRNLGPVNSGLVRLQSIGFKAVEWSKQSDMTFAFRNHWKTSKIPEALCLSSFGPTLFALTEEPSRVLEVINSFGVPPIHCQVTSPRNDGIRIYRKKGEIYKNKKYNNQYSMMV